MLDFNICVVYFGGKFRRNFNFETAASKFQVCHVSWERLEFFWRCKLNSLSYLKHLNICFYSTCMQMGFNNKGLAENPTEPAQEKLEEIRQEMTNQLDFGGIGREKNAQQGNGWIWPGEGEIHRLRTTGKVDEWNENQAWWTRRRQSSWGRTWAEKLLEDH